MHRGRLSSQGAELIKNWRTVGRRKMMLFIYDSPISEPAFDYQPMTGGGWVDGWTGKRGTSGDEGTGMTTDDRTCVSNFALKLIRIPREENSALNRL